MLLRKEWAFHYNHCTADLVRHRIGRARFDDYTSFCVVRNPWDRAVSMYWWNKNREDGHAIDESISFSDYIKNAPRKLVTDQDVYMIDGKVVVDHIIKFEDLQNGLDDVMQKIGLPKLSLPRAKGGTRKRRNIIQNSMMMKLGISLLQNAHSKLKDSAMNSTIREIDQAISSQPQPSFCSECQCIKRC